MGHSDEQVYHTLPRKDAREKLNYSLKRKGKKEMKKETWKTILQVIVTVLTALCTSLGVTSCMQYM